MKMEFLTSKCTKTYKPPESFDGLWCSCILDLFLPLSFQIKDPNKLTMKTSLALLSLLLFKATFAQKTVDLRWNIQPNESLVYKTEMFQVDDSEYEVEFNFPFNSNDPNANKELNARLAEIKKILANVQFVSTLTHTKKEFIDIVMSTELTAEASEIEEEEWDDEAFDREVEEMDRWLDSINQLEEENEYEEIREERLYTDENQSEKMKAFFGDNQVLLRGSVYETGDIHSFWVKTDQKNLLALLFQLPSTPKKVGDTWPLDVHLIANNQAFICDSSYQLNKVTLTEIKEVNGETIAVLQYEIQEFVQGKLELSSFQNTDANHDEPTTLSFSFIGKAEFSVTKGRWNNYLGLLAMKATGVMKAKVNTKFALIPEN